MTREARIKDIKKALAQYEKLRAGGDADCPKLTYSERTQLQSRLVTTLERCAPKESRYMKMIRPVFVADGGMRNEAIERFVGILKALLDDYKNDRVQQYDEIVHAEVFSDMLDTAAHFNELGHLQHAAWGAGMVLEGHLRQLSTKAGISIQVNGKYQKAEGLNAELCKAGVYSITDQKNVTAWLGRRNDAAHPTPPTYTKKEIEIMIDGVRHFMSRFPA